MANLKSFGLSDQALGAVMLALQRSLMEQSDIVPVLKGMSFVPTDDGLIVKNPPVVRFDSDGMVLFDDPDEEGASLADNSGSD